MKCIFTDKNLLKQEYIHSFLENLSHLGKLKQCLCGRYDKKSISDETLKKLFTNNHKFIFDFTGESNQDRITHFFGNEQQLDMRDRQIRLIDRLILDSIHFEIMVALLTRLNDEYDDNKEEIEKCWSNEIQENNDMGPLEPFFILQKILNLEKNSYFEDLEFPKQQYLALFSLKQSGLQPNKRVFNNWISQTKLTPNKYLNGVPELITTLLIIFFIYGIVIGSLAISLSMFTLILAVGVSLDFSILNFFPNASYDNSLLAQDDTKTCSSSHDLMLTKMPSCLASGAATHDKAVTKPWELPKVQEFDPPLIIEEDSDSIYRLS